VPKLHELQEKYKEKAQFLFVYILEAHAQNEWPISSSRCSPGGKRVIINQTNTIEERLTVANAFIDAFQLKIPVIIDSVQNDFEKVYASWPLRAYVIKNGTLIYKAQPGEKMLEMQEIIDILQEA